MKNIVLMLALKNQVFRHKSNEVYTRFIQGRYKILKKEIEKY